MSNSETGDSTVRGSCLTDSSVTTRLSAVSGLSRHLRVRQCGSGQWNGGVPGGGTGGVYTRGYTYHHGRGGHTTHHGREATYPPW